MLFILNSRLCPSFFSFAGSFFLGNSTVGNTLILRCPRNDSVSWLLSQGDNLPMEISNGANPLVVSDFSETTNGGLYFCVNTNAFGSFVYFQRVLSLSSFGGELSSS